MKLHLNKDLFVDMLQLTSESMGIKAVYIEKDYWVTYALFSIFNDKIGKDTVFKGGTALSKCYNMIERFSEDVDLSFNRAELGFAGESDPLNATTGKKRKHGLEALTEMCQRVIPPVPT